jgi:hypothetical protein
MGIHKEMICTGPCKCMVCGRKWTAQVKTICGLLLGELECPSCGLMAGEPVTALDNGNET